MTKRSQNFNEAMVSLYHLISLADGEISQRELEMCTLMRKTEEINDGSFNEIIKRFDRKTHSEIYKTCVGLLRTCPVSEQIACLAWMRYIANCDGFMAREEWSLIFKIYKKELNLNLNDIMNYELPLYVTNNH